MEITFEKQTKLKTETIRGNCMVACYANVLGLKISQCPPFEELFDCAGSADFWFECVNLWFKGLGYTLVQCKSISEIPKNVEYYFAYGISPRDVMHQVIYKDGKMFFDPNPANDGILTEEGFEYLVLTNPAKSGFNK